MPLARVLGIDPGTRRLGWGVVEPRGPQLVAVAAGVVKLPEAEALATRLAKVHDALAEIIETYGPATLAVEDIFYAEFPAAAIKLGHVRGVVLLVGAQRELEVASYAPALVKRTIAGRGAADKAQIGRLVAAKLGLRAPPPTDAADALAVAITHCAKARFAR
jgi:crossover junction endodeoxyribonuclease RuvC